MFFFVVVVVVVFHDVVGVVVVFVVAINDFLKIASELETAPSVLCKNVTLTLTDVLRSKWKVFTVI